VQAHTDDDDVKIPVEDAYFMNHSKINTPFHELTVASEYNKNFHIKIEERICLLMSKTEDGYKIKKKNEI